MLPEKTLEETVGAALDSEEAPISPTSGAAATDESATAPEAPASPPESEASGPERDEKGRFTAKDGAKGEADAGTEADAGEQEKAPEGGEGAGEEGQAQAETEDLTPPQHWSAEAQEMFRAQPPEVQKYMLDRHRDMEGDYTRKTQEIAPVRQVMDKWRDYCRQNGSNPEQAYDSLMQTEYVLRSGTPQQKLDTLATIARTYQIDIRPLIGGAPQETEDDDPIAGHPVLRQLIDSQRQISDYLTQQSQTQQHQAVNQSNHAIEAFRAEKDASGQSAHPHFDEVAADMIALAQTERAMGRAPVLKDLYERAAWANPSVRAKMLSTEAHAKRKAEDKRKREEAERARKAGVSITGSPSSTPDKPKTLDDEVREAMTASG